MKGARYCIYSGDVNKDGTIVYVDRRLKTKALAYRAVKEAIETYNEHRPHMSINYMTPNQKMQQKRKKK